MKTSKLSGKLFILKAKNFNSKQKNFIPPVDKAGRIGDTQFLDVLRLKVGSRVMLIFNLGNFSLPLTFLFRYSMTFRCK